MLPRRNSTMLLLLWRVVPSRLLATLQLLLYPLRIPRLHIPYRSTMRQGVRHNHVQDWWTVKHWGLFLRPWQSHSCLYMPCAYSATGESSSTMH